MDSTRFALTPQKEATFQRELTGIASNTIYELRSDRNTINVSSCRSSARYFNGAATLVNIKYLDMMYAWLEECVDHFNVTEKYVFIKKINANNFAVIYDKGQKGDGNDIHPVQLLFMINETWGPYFLEMWSLIKRNVKKPTPIEIVSLACYLTSKPRKVDKERIKINNTYSGYSFYGRFPFCTICNGVVNVNKDPLKDDRRKTGLSAHFTLAAVHHGIARLVIESIDIEKLTYFQMIQYMKAQLSFYIMAAGLLTKHRTLIAAGVPGATANNAGLQTVTVADTEELGKIFKRFSADALRALGNEAPKFDYLTKPFK